MKTNVEEVWKDLEGYDFNYQVSSLGRVRRLEIRIAISPDNKGHGRKRTLREKILKAEKRYVKSNGETVSIVSLYKEGKQKRIYMANLLAMVFVTAINNV